MEGSLVGHLVRMGKDVLGAPSASGVRVTDSLMALVLSWACPRGCLWEAWRVKRRGASHPCVITYGPLRWRAGLRLCSQLLEAAQGQVSMRSRGSSLQRTGRESAISDPPGFPNPRSVSTVRRRPLSCGIHACPLGPPRLLPA